MLKKTVSNPPSSYPNSDAVIKKATRQGVEKIWYLPSLILTEKFVKSFKLIYGYEKVLPIVFFLPSQGIILDPKTKNKTKTQIVEK